jgi:hypothetical protein
MKTSSVVINLMGNQLKILQKRNQTVLAIYNKARTLSIAAPLCTSIIFDESTFNVELVLRRNFNFYKLLETNLNNILFNFNRLWHIKIKFAGKGFKIKRKRKTKSIKFYFYYSHVNVIILKNAKLKQRKKNRFIIKT